MPMKQSIYNTILDFENGRSIIYNALSDTFVVTLTSHIPQHNIMAITNATLRTQLESNGMIVEDSLDEVEEVKKQIERIDTDMRNLHIHINPTLACNFNCWYCYENHSNTSHMQPDMITAVLKLIKSRIEEFKSESVNLSFFGGEPLLQFKNVVKPLIEQVDEVCKTRKLPLDLHFTTNSFLLTDEMIRFFSDLSVAFQITLDGHRENHDKVRRTNSTGSYDIILNNVKRLLRDKHPVILRINYTTKNFDDIPAILEDLKDISLDHRPLLTIDFQQVWQDISDSQQSEMRRKTEMTIEETKKQNFQCSAPLHCDIIHNPCYGDRRNHVLINHDGLLYFCTARDFTKNNSVGKLNLDGKIEWRKDAVNSWKNSKFDKIICQQCRIAPICGGSCRQKSMETKHLEKCLRGYSDEDIDHVVSKRFYQHIVQSQKQVN